MRTRVALVCLLIAAACGPPGLGGETASESSTSEGTTSTPSDEETESETTGVPPTTSATSTGPGFIPPKEDVGLFECDPFAQDCPEGEKCVPYGSTGGNWDANKCVPVMGDQAPGESCWYGGVVEATDDCDATSHCWDVMAVDGEAIGTCMPFCTGSPNEPVCPPLSDCSTNGNGSINICTPTCDPIAQNCGDGLACYWANSNFHCIFTTENHPAGELM